MGNGIGNDFELASDSFADTLRARRKNRERLGIKITDDLQFIEVIVKSNE